MKIARNMEDYYCCFFFPRVGHRTCSACSSSGLSVYVRVPFAFNFSILTSLFCCGHSVTATYYSGSWACFGRRFGSLRRVEEGRGLRRVRRAGDLRVFFFLTLGILFHQIPNFWVSYVCIGRLYRLFCGDCVNRSMLSSRVGSCTHTCLKGEWRMVTVC